VAVATSEETPSPLGVKSAHQAGPWL